MKTTLRILLALLTAASAFSCNRSESFTYTDTARINFTSDSLYFSFGAEPFSITDTTLRIGVEIIGTPVGYDREFRIGIDASRTTAQAGIHYDPLPSDPVLPAGASAMSLPIRIHRLRLEDDKVHTLSIYMEECANFKLGVSEYTSLRVCFTNRLDCPNWWNELSRWIGEYDIRKYQKFIELYGRPVSDQDIRENKFAILRVFKEVREYFARHPEYGVLFPDTEWPV
ncbi:DUF4843 domain-containing protein [Alistipes sp.]|uniref:DUF4843 domain-containing protein n=1 Tax=Alistipes sp. TaxID=1872444 RepID=UPI0025BD5961|nr:DUF4843 domain-containing protein [Alistipes sp.]